MYLSSSKDSNVSSESVNQPWHEYHADIYNLYNNKDPICFIIIGCQAMAMSNKRALGQIAPPFKISFLITENWPQMKYKSLRILLKIIHLASSSHIWSLFAENHTLTKSKSRSIASRITNLSPRKTYLVIILPNSYQKLTKSKIRSSWSRFEHCSKSLISPLWRHIWSLFASIHMKSWPK